MTWVIMLIAVAVAGVALFFALRPTPPGAGQLDAQGRPARTGEVNPQPAGTHSDPLANAIGDAVSSIYRIAANWK